MRSDFLTLPPMLTLLLLFSFASFSTKAFAFVPLSQTALKQHYAVPGERRSPFVVVDVPQTNTVAFSSKSDDDSEGKKKKKRRRRKTESEVLTTSSSSGGNSSSIGSSSDLEDTKDDETSTSSTTTTTTTGSRSNPNAFVEMKVRDIREITIPDTTDETSASSAESQSTGVTTTSSDTKNDSLDSLLADAKRMRGSKTQDEDSSVGNKIRDVISTIVTIDFFVVFGLLLWFLAGIVCSSVLQDDTVQIAFNNIFEPVVQPALGVLMIASVASALGNKDDDEKE